MHRITLTALLGLVAIVSVNGHGRLLKPPGRATLWMFEEYKQFNPEPDYDDTQSFCGGFDVRFLTIEHFKLLYSEDLSISKGSILSLNYAIFVGSIQDERREMWHLWRS